MDENVRLIVDEIVLAVSSYGLSVVGAVVLLVVGWIAANWVKRWILKVVDRTERVDETLGRFGASLARYAILIFTLIAVMSQFGIETTSLIAVMGAFGLAIGLALQGTLGHIASGVMLLLFRPFKVGDFVETSAATGTIRAINLFTTEFAAADNVQIIVPNGTIWGGDIKNFSANDRRRTDITVGVSYDANLDTAIRVLGELVGADARVHGDPEPLIAVTGLGDSAVDILVRYWSGSSDFFALKLDMTKAIKEQLDAEGIGIPYPQMDVHVVNSDQA